MPTLTWEDLGVGSHKVETLMMSSYLLNSSKMIATKVPIRATGGKSSSEDEARFSFSCQPHQVMWVQRKNTLMMAHFMEHGCLQPQTRHCSINEWNNVAFARYDSDSSKATENTHPFLKLPLARAPSHADTSRAGLFTPRSLAVAFVPTEDE
jgi:hypothetical protein